MNNQTRFIHNFTDKISVSDVSVIKLEPTTQEDSYNLAEICRICMVNDPCLINLWSSPTEKFDQEFYQIKDVLASFTSVLIDENESLPQGICGKCEGNIYFAYTFKQKCERSEEILRNVIQRQAEKSFRIELIVPAANQEEMVAEESCDLQDIMTPIETGYTCDQCSETFEQRVQLNQHIKKVHKLFKCQECGEYFAQPQILKRHLKIHAGIKNEVCPFCERGFLRSDDLKRHIRVHTGEKPFKCEQCPKTYKQSTELIQHKLTHSNVKQFTCKLCNKSLSTRTGYYIHMKVHNGQKDHQCHMCNKKFVTSCELTSHVQYIHKKEKLFKCTIPDCSKRFVTKICLNQHLKNHPPKSMEYQCPICKEQLSTSQTFKKHMKLHKTTVMDDLNDHIENKFMCEICKKVFEFYSTLKTHIMASHTTFICELCGITSLDYDEFILHKDLHNDLDDAAES